MQRLDLRMLRAVEIVHIIALDRLMKKRKPQRQDQSQNKQQALVDYH